ncbi:uncharacterized protein BX664DRAFT_322142 [Halteromyces radiatus]|uniref:uncharacterized protein n=1 Tax=Halteromyces radiatus TaxID=101107 RepID=UPI00221FFEDF|nr:uncharacterized protein BX664DRAFT_322142 [Halteromyces radiatus]KAI8099800.1 hypothetical protein BX664DRAFT_322142 [Halteromyces radiatus]
MSSIDQVEESTSKSSLKPYTFPRVRSWLHICQVITTLLVVAMISPVIALQIQYKGYSAPGPNYTLYVAIFTFLTPIFLVFFPWMYESKNKMKWCGKFFLKPRTNLIFTGFYSLLWLTAGIGITTYTLNADTCSLDSNQKDSGYASAWTAQCNCARVSIALVWLTCLLWITTLILALIVFWKQKQLVQKNLQQIAQSKQETVELTTEIVDQDINNNNTQVLNQQTPTNPMPPSDLHHSSATNISPNITTTTNNTNTTNQGMTATVSEPYLPSFAGQSYPSSAMNSMQYQYPSSVSPPQPQVSASYSHQEQQHQPYYNDAAAPQQQQPVLPLAVMPDPQHYRQQHRYV